ncbi:MAG TPA: flagellar biosynthesis anti-sigma factor FlgM [Terriglobales bacterium]|nr:flagellar biosynthesis anti-sigma factor FlgM [Terriglobales bacterium]
MRVDLQSSYLALSESQKTDTKSAPLIQREPVSTDPSIDVHVSALGTQASSAPDIRQDRVAELRQAIASGTYSVSNEALAGAMMRDLLQQ